MSFYRKNPLFAFGLAVCTLLVTGELALIYERFFAARAAGRRFTERKAELEGMAQLNPPPTREIAGAIEANLAQAQAALAAMQGELQGRGPAAERMRSARIPAARTDAYFDLATFVEKTRARAKQAEVDVRPEASRFGFSAFANEGPVQDHIEPVFRQRQVAQYLIESLIDARPRSILAVRREHTLSKADREARAAALANGEVPAEVPADEGPDYFTVDPRVSARVSGFIDTLPFRFVFTGQTAALRTFLNQLATFELPVLVREVEVDTATTEEAATPAASDEATNPPEPPVAEANAPSILLSIAAPAGPPPASVAAKARTPAPTPRAPTAIPIVSKPLSRFTVTVEFIELVPPAATPAEAPPPEPTPSPGAGS
jgi:hypothetical protein